MDWNILRELLVPGASCVLTTHYSIDGDAIGSELALAAFLRQTGAEPRIINQDPVPRIYGFLDEHNEAMVYDGSADAAIREADLAFLLDVSAWSRIGAPAEAIQASRAKRICIDHHTTNSGIAEINMTDSTAAATAELIYDMLGAVGGEITPAIARALFVGIATDTGWFRFPNASARAFEIAACLTSRGAAPAELFSLVHEQLRWERMGLLGAGLSELQSAAGGKIAWMALTREMFERTGADSEDVEGIIDILRTIEGVEIAILFREACDGGAPSIRVSLRSKNETDVSRLAEKFGGGGHIRAAGIRMRGMSLREAIDKIVAAAEETVGSNDSR
jgi:phosphoesterase RecJ-like protein